MGLFWNKKNDAKVQVPEWASFFSDKEYKKFISIIDRYFKGKGVNYIIENGVINDSGDASSSPDEKSIYNNLGLSNISQLCNQLPRRKWKKALKKHLEGLVKSYEFEKKFKKDIAANFDYIKPFLGVKLYHIGYITNSIGRELVVGKDLTDDIFEMLVFDFPQSVTNVQPEYLRNWNKSIDELFEIGINNIRANYPIKITKQKVKEFEMWFAQGNHLFVSNVIFDLKNNSKLIGSSGTLIGIPNRGTTLIYPIDNMEVVKAINALIPIIYGMNNDGPGSISSNLYWYKDGIWTDLPYKLTDNKFEFLPPDTFVESLKVLSKK